MIIQKAMGLAIGLWQAGMGKAVKLSTLSEKVTKLLDFFSSAPPKALASMIG